jgi:putative ABC transport system permease protein
MASEVRPIGAMKALGATRGRIVRLYLPQALLLGSAALLVAAPVGLWGSRALTSFLAVFLNFDIASFAAPAWVHALAGAVGLGVPFLAAVPSVWKGTRVPVREALADFGATRDAFGTGVLDRWLARAGGRSRPVLLAVRNVFRRRARLGLTLATLTTAGLFFLSALNVRASLVHTLDRFFALHPYDLQVGLRGMAPHASIDRAAARTEGIVRVEKWIATEGAVPSAGGTAAPEASRPSGAHGGGGHGGGGHGGGAGGDRFPVLALPAGTGLLAFDLVEGRGLESGETDAMVVNEALAARRPQFRAGSTVPVQMGPAVVAWRVVGVTREPFAPPVAYVPLAFFEARGHVDQANALRVKLAGTDAGSVNRVKDALERHLGAEGVRVTSNLSRAERRLGFDQHMLMIYVFLFVVAGILGVIGGLGLMTTLSLNVLERRRELGVLRAIGATPGTIGRIVIAEGAFTALLGALLASLLSWPASRALGDLAVQVMFRSRVDFALDPLGPPAWSLLSLLLGGLASFLPAWHASRRSVREAISWE